MMSVNIIDVSEETFESEVIAYSAQMPVVVDLWAPWCIPCLVQSQTLTRMAQEANGRFRLARINVDEQTKLAELLKVRDLPAIKAFVDGRIVGDYLGVLSEKHLRQFIERIMPRTASLSLSKGKGLLILGKYQEAEEAIRHALDERGDQPDGLLAYARVMLAQGDGRIAQDVLEHFPASPELETAELLLPLAEAYQDPVINDFIFDNPLESIYRNALRMAKEGKILIALDGLLSLLKKDKHYRNDQAKAVYLGLLEVLSNDHPEARNYRADLAGALF